MTEELAALASHELFGTQRVAIRACFDAMQIAEEEIARMYPTRAAEPAGLFEALVIPPSMRGLTSEVFRAHAAELVGRAHRHEDLALATRAEVLVSALAAATVAPPREAGAALIDLLFREILPADYANLDDLGAAPRESWAGQVEEDIRAAQRGMRDESRRLTPPRRRRRSLEQPALLQARAGDQDVDRRGVEHEPDRGRDPGGHDDAMREGDAEQGGPGRAADVDDDRRNNAKAIGCLG